MPIAEIACDCINLSTCAFVFVSGRVRVYNIESISSIKITT